MSTVSDIEVVYVWSDRHRDFVATRPERVVCPECGARADAGLGLDRAMWWDETGWGEAFLQCQCGEQFSTEEGV